MTRPIRTAFLLPALAALAISLAGCAGSGGKATVGAGRAFPADTAAGEVFDIQVFRRVTRLVMTNTTSTEFGPSTVWVNKRFSSTIEGFTPGQTLELDLREFTDEFGEVFRAGGFFAARIPDQVILVQLETPTTEGMVMAGLVIVSNEVD